MSKEEKIKKFHKHILKVLVKEYLKYGLTSVPKINEVKAKKILEEPLWKTPEAPGKYKVRYISEGVLELINKLGLDINNFKIKTIQDYLKNNLNYTLESGIVINSEKDIKIQLEHVTPRSYLIEQIIENPNEIDNLLDNYCVGCVVLKAEHNKLSDDFKGNDLWCRYKDAELRVWDKLKNEWVFSIY